jgi:1-carboxybiuret hydrolase subunit AtzG-like protein
MTKRAKALRRSKASRTGVTKAARSKTARSKTARSKIVRTRNVRAKAPRPGAARAKSVPAAPDALDQFIAAAAHALALPVEAAWKGAVKANLEVTLRLAASFADFPLPDDAEPAPVFTA